MSERENVDSTSADAGERIICHFLDMGKDKYGDCILVIAGDRSVMIDGGHPHDLQGQRGFASIPEQLEHIFGRPGPFDITLIVVTHGHNDHIGCLPELVQQGIVRPAYALVTDPSHCFPPGARDAAPLPDAIDDPNTGVFLRVMTGLAEEDHSDLPDEELGLFLDRTVRLGTRYRNLLQFLEEAQVPVIRWGVTPADELAQVYSALEGMGFDVIAPTIEHLELCRDQIVSFATDARDRLVDAMSRMAARDSALPTRDMAARLYRGAGQDAPIDATDRRGQGSALNCQSIMLTFGPPNGRVLLTGDMQFAAPEVDGIDEHMQLLLQAAADAGPYRCLKLPHHSSYNGIDAELWAGLGRPEIVVHSGGSDDPGHPERDILRQFEALDDEMLFLRTDRNGLITVDLGEPNLDRAVRVSRGELDDFSTNKPRRRDEEAASASTSGSGASAAVPTAGEETGGGVSEPAVRGNSSEDCIDILFVRLPLDTDLTMNGFSVRASRSGGGSSRDDRPRGRPDPAARLAGGRRLPPLLFVTASDALARNVGQREAAAAIAMIRQDAKLIDLAGTRDGRAAIRQELQGGEYAGVVIVGGYDVVPSERVDVLDPQLRQRLPRRAVLDDQDEFIVWSDDGWADADGDGLAELPVSRIPDARSSDLLMTALTADDRGVDGAFGIRNELRPFADAIYTLIEPGRRDWLLCAPTRAEDLPVGVTARRNLYFMLHGDHRDAARFWGDSADDGEVLEAVNVSSLPRRGLDVVFAGCCWGALTVQQLANSRDTVIAPRSVEESMALACLRAGARAFIGCTGVHYSPDESGGFFGAPMHRAFWSEHLRGDLPPARALFEARGDYLRDMPHGRRTAHEIAIERKIYKQFTCLGLGW